MQRHAEIFLLGFVMLVAVGLRFWQLGTVPYGYAYDEAGIMYDAWSISLWHRDQFAHFMPLSFQSFGDYKPPFLIYLLAAIYFFTGVHEVVIRVVSALAGVGSVFVIYFLARDVFLSQKKSTSVGIITAAVVAISPWSVHLSRVGFEQNITFFLGLTGLWLFIKGFRSARYLWMAAFFLSASCYAFHTAKIFIPLALGWTFFWFRQRSESLKQLIGPVILMFGLLLPLGYSSLFQQGNERAKTLLLYTSSGTLARPAEILHQFGNNVVRQLSPAFWTFGWDGVSIRHAVPGYGVLVWPVYVIFLISIGWLVFRERRSITWWIFGLLLIGLAPALVSRQTPHVLRSQFALIACALCIEYGVDSLFIFSRQHFHKNWVKLVSLGLMVTVILVTSMYIKTYFGPYATQSAASYQYGYREAVAYINTIKQPEDTILVTRSYEQPYIYLLLYNRIHPQAFLFGALNQYQIQDIVWPDSRTHAIFLATPMEIPYTDPRVIKIVYVPHTNQPVLVIARNE